MFFETYFQKSGFGLALEGNCVLLGLAVSLCSLLLQQILLDFDIVGAILARDGRSGV